MAFLEEKGVSALWAKCKAWFARTLSVSGATITLKNNAGDILSQVTIPDATASTPGVMTAQDKARLEGLVTAGGEPNQNAFAKVSANGTTIEADLVSDTLNLAAGDNVTIAGNASTDTVTISAKDTTYGDATTSAAGLMSASDKAKLDGVDAGANKYTHPTTAGNKHIPSGGSSGQILRWSAAGTAVWGADSDTTYDAATSSAAGLMSAADKAKLDGVATGANAYTHPSHTAKSSGLYKVTVDTQGHVSATAAVAKSDITDLGIPAQDTTYGDATTSAAGLMTAAMVTKLNGIATGATKVTVDSALSSSSTNPVQNKAVQTAIANAVSAAAAAQSTADSKATMTEVNAAIASAQVGAAMYQGTLSANSTISDSSYKAGWYWVVGTAGTYVGESCEAGDMIFANSDKGSSYSADHFDVVQSNIQAMTVAEVEAICV